MKRILAAALVVASGAMATSAALTPSVTLNINAGPITLIADGTGLFGGAFLVGG